MQMCERVKAQPQRIVRFMALHIRIFVGQTLHSRLLVVENRGHD